MHTILIVEDDPAVQGFARATLATQYTVQVVSTVAAALDVLHLNPVDLVLLDLNLGGDDGMTVATYLRQHHPYTALVIITGQGTLQTAIRAIELGAQGYLLKPVRPETLRETVQRHIAQMQAARHRDSLASHMQAAIEALHGRAETPPPGTLIASGKLMMDRSRYDAVYDGRTLSLSPSQFRVLWTLVEATGQPVAAGDLVREALGYEVGEAEARELIKGYISQLRRRLAECDEQREFIRTIRGHGYLWIKPT